MAVNSRDISKQYNISAKRLDAFLSDNKEVYQVKFSPLTMLHTIPEDQVKKAVSDYRAMRRAEIAEQEKREGDERAEKQRLRQACSSMLITSGFSFEGYSIKKYSGYISGDDVIQVSRGTDSIFTSAVDAGEALSKSLVTLRRNALQELKESAYELGCNAVIGVDFDYMTLAPETANFGGGTTYLPYIFCVTANGNAVVIEKND